MVLTPHLGASTSEAQESVGVEIAHAISEYLLNGIINNAVNVPNVDLRTLALIRPYLGLGEKLGRLLAQIAPHGLETLTINYTGKVSETETVPITRSVLKGLLFQCSEMAVNEVNAPKAAQNLGLKVTRNEERRSRRIHRPDHARGDQGRRSVMKSARRSTACFRASCG